MVFQPRRGYSFDDLNLLPAYSTLLSRKEVKLYTKLWKGQESPEILPIIPANMPSIVGLNMVSVMERWHCIAPYHRYWKDKDDLESIWTAMCLGGASLYNIPIGISVGTNLVEIEIAIETCIHAADGPSYNYEVSPPDYVVIDVAHGHSTACHTAIQWVKKTYPDIKIIAGNVCTYEAAKGLFHNGVDCVKVGIGPGSRCTTRRVCGVGMPQFTAIMDCARAAKHAGGTIIADGGIRTTGDIMKALAAGAHAVMVGGMFAGCKETPGQVVTLANGKFKNYEGMASLNHQITHSGGEAEDIAEEGVSTMVSYTGMTVDKVMKKIVKSLKAGFAYCGAYRLEHLHAHGLNSDSWIKVSNAGYIEGTPHGV